MSDLMNAIIAAKLMGNGGGGGGGGLPPIEKTSTVIMPQTTVAFSDTDGMYTAPTDFIAESGVTYTITWDGTDYECTPLVMYGEYALGNMGIAGGEDTGEPFLLTNALGSNAWVTLSTAATHVCKIVSLVQAPPDGTALVVANGEWQVQSGYGYEVGGVTTPINRRFIPAPCMEIPIQSTIANVIRANSTGMLTFDILTTIDYPIEALYVAFPSTNAEIMVIHGGTTADSPTTGTVWLFNPNASDVSIPKDDIGSVYAIPSAE